MAIVLKRIDAFDSVLSASFVAILFSPNFARRRASNLCVLHNTIYTKYLFSLWKHHVNLLLQVYCIHHANVQETYQYTQSHTGQARLDGMA